MPAQTDVQASSATVSQACSELKHVWTWYSAVFLGGDPNCSVVCLGGSTRDTESKVQSVPKAAVKAEADVSVCAPDVYQFGSFVLESEKAFLGRNF